MSVSPVPTADDIAEMLEQVWVSYLDPEGVDPLIRVDGAKDGTDLHSSVSITGSWHGHVVYACSAAAARQAAAAFLAMDADEVSQEDISDVLGELANIVGGNVKAMLPPGCLLSLPQVVLAPVTAIRYPAEVKICELHGRWRDEPVLISMWQGREDVVKEETE